MWIVDDSHVPAARILAALAALAVCAWFTIGIVQARDTSAAGAIIVGARAPTAAQAAHAGALLSDAGTLYPGVELQLLRSALALRLGDAAAARSLALRAARQEPLNVQAWVAYGRASAADPAAFRIALAHVRALVPAIAPVR